MRRNGFRIEEIGTEKHASLEAAQEAALPVLADALAQIIRDHLDSGRYIADNGVLKLREEANDE